MVHRGAGTRGDLSVDVSAHDHLDLGRAIPMPALRSHSPLLRPLTRVARLAIVLTLIAGLVSLAARVPAKAATPATAPGSVQAMAAGAAPGYWLTTSAGGV